MIVGRMARDKTDEDLVEAVGRLIRAVGRRSATRDPDSAAWLEYLGGELADAYQAAVTGWRQAGFSDSQIGRELGITKQAVAQRWPRTPPQLRSVPSSVGQTRLC